MDQPKRVFTRPEGFGGRQEGAGRPELPPEQRTVRRVVYLPPDINGRLVDSVTDERGCVGDEIIRILRLYYETVPML